MKKIPIQMPPGIRYLSQWPELWDSFPNAHFILNKKLCNIGATHMFLSDPKHKVILCSPRCALLESKQKKHPDVWFYRGSLMDNGSVDNDKPPKKKKTTYEDVKLFNADCALYINTCYANGQTPHIMSTYDSLGHVIDVLHSISPTEIDSWILVIDEFQAVFADAAYKATTELTFLNNAKFFRQAIFLSATPYLEDYMKQLPDFASMDYYQLDWSDDMQEKAVVHNITLPAKQSIPATCKKIIDCMRASKPVRFGGIEIATKECVFYINKVSTIVAVINKCKLLPSEVNILCAKSDANDKRLKDIGHLRGDFPQEGSEHKMFTFCTRTSFLGVDFWSTCAYSYVFADPSQKTLALDISTDLSQILGRQRLSINPYQHEAILFLKENSVGKDDDEFSSYIEAKQSTTDMLIDNFNSASPELQNVLLKKYRKAVEHEHYSDDYLCVRDDKATGKAILEFNKLVMLSEIRAWEIRKKNYQGQYSVICQQNQAGILGMTATASTNPDVISFKAAFDASHSTQDRIRMYAEFMRDHADLADEIDFASHKYKDYWDAFGFDTLKSFGYQESKIKAALKQPPSQDDKLADVTRKVRSMLEVKRYTYSEMKGVLQKAYKAVGYQKTAAATDAGKYVTAKQYQAPGGKRYIEVLSLYQKQITIFPFVWKINVPITEGITIDRMLDIIETGKYKVSKSKTVSRNLKDSITDIHNLHLVKDKKKIKAEWLPVACVNGVFKNKHDHSLLKYSSFLALDYDGFTSLEAMEKAKEALKTFEFIYAIFTTPSGSGLKAIVLHDSCNPDYHRNLYKQIEKVCSLPQTDMSVSDLSRGHFLSYDPQLWRNPSPKAFHFQVDSMDNIDNVKKTECISVKTNTDNDIQLDTWESKFMHSLWESILTDDAILERLDKYWSEKKSDYFREGNRHRGMLIIAGTLCQAGVIKQKAVDYLILKYPDKEQKEILSVIEYAYDSNPYGCQRRAYN